MRYFLKVKELNQGRAGLWDTETIDRVVHKIADESFCKTEGGEQQ